LLRVKVSDAIYLVGLGALVTIKKGESWGEPGELELAGEVVSSDSELAAVLQKYREAQQVPPVVGLLAGSLHRTFGSPQRDESLLRSGQGYLFPIDVGVLGYQDAHGKPREVVFVAHLAAFADPRLRLWRRRTVIAMNAAFLGELNLGPRAHPNDGRLDVTDGQLNLSQRRQAVRRAVVGTHVPHPDLLQSRVSSRVEIFGDSEFALCADGVPVGASKDFWIECLPDAARILV